jgi:hypothetical protein
MQARDWRAGQQWIAELLERRTGAGVEVWNPRVRDQGFSDEHGLRAWLSRQGVTGHPQTLLVMEQFGDPDFLTASADQLIDGQYRDRAELRPMFEAVIVEAMAIGETTVQARKTYVSLLTPQRTFAAVRATTRKRVDVGLRLAGVQPGGRLESAASIGSSAASIRIGLTSLDEIDDEFRTWLRRSYEENV